MAFLAEKPTLSNNAFQLLVKKLSKLVHCGDFVGQRMLTVVVATGVIPRAELCLQTYIASSTLTYSKVVERYGYSSWDDLDRGVRAAAAALGITPHHVDQLACEKFREDPRVDCHIPGMCVWELEEGDPTGAAGQEPYFVRIAQDGSESLPRPITLVKDAHPNREPNVKRYPDFTFPDSRSKKLPEGEADQWNWTCYPKAGTKATNIPGYPERPSQRPKGSLGKTKQGDNVYRSIHFDSKSEGRKYFLDLAWQGASLNQMRRKFSECVETGGGCYSTRRVAASIPKTTNWNKEGPPKPQLPRVRRFPNDHSPQVVDQYSGLYDPEFLGMDIKTIQKKVYGKKKPWLPRETQPMIPTPDQKAACKAKYGFLPTQFSARPVALNPATPPTSTDSSMPQKSGNKPVKTPPKKSKSASDCYNSSSSDSTEEKKWKHRLTRKCKARRQRSDHTHARKMHDDLSSADGDSTSTYNEDTGSEYEDTGSDVYGSTMSGSSSEYRTYEDSIYEDSSDVSCDEDGHSYMTRSQSDMSSDRFVRNQEERGSCRNKDHSTRLWEDEYCFPPGSNCGKGWAPVRHKNRQIPDSDRRVGRRSSRGSSNMGGYQKEWGDEYRLPKKASGRRSKEKTKEKRSRSQGGNKRKVKSSRKSRDPRKKRSHGPPREVSVGTA